MPVDGSSASTGKRKRSSESADEADDAMDVVEDSDAGGEDEDENEEHAPRFDIERDQDYPYFKRIFLKNFMCHEELNVHFNPRINFVYGRNGSGKSAVLLGLALGLGCSSRATKRARNLRSNVGPNDSKAVITITIHQGGDRYKGNFEKGEFGQDIIVQRTITKSGGSQYKLMKDKKTVLSTKKEDLVSILQFLSIQPDNPVQFMQQEHSKTFLHAGNPDKYYEFFARATRLQEYEEEMSRIDQMKKSLVTDRARSEKQHKTFLQSDFDEARQAFESMQYAIKLSDKENALIAELLWAAERDAARVVERGQEKRDALFLEIKRIEDKAAKYSETAANHGQQVEAFAAEVEQAQAEQKDADAERKDAESAVRNAQRERADAENEAKGADQGINVFEKRIQDLRKQIKDQRRETAQHRSVKRRQSGTDVPALEAELGTLKERLQPKYAELQRLTEQDRANVEAANAAKGRVAHLQREFVTADNHVKELDRSVGNQLANFKGDVANISRVLQQASGFARPPIGPIGKYIKMRPEGAQYKDAVSACLTWTGLQTFLVFGGQNDKARCEQALNGKVNAAFRCDFANTDSFSHAKLGSNRAPCLLDLIEIDPNASEEERRVVMNYLVDRYKFNEIRVASTFDEANAISSAGPETVRLDNGVRHVVTRHVYFYNPVIEKVERQMKNGTSSYLPNVPRGVFSEDQTEVRRNAEAAKVRAEEELREATQHASGKASEVKRSQQEVVLAKKEAKALEGQIEALSRKVRVEKEKQRAEDDAEEEPDNTEVLEKEIDDTRAKLNAALEKKAEWEEAVGKLQAALDSAKEVRGDRLARFNEKAQAAAELAGKVAALAAEKQRATGKLETVKLRLEKNRKELNAMETELAGQEKELGERHETAVKEHQAKITTDKTQAELQRTLEEYRNKIRKMERALGVSRETAKSNWLKAQKEDQKKREMTTELRNLEQEVQAGSKKRRDKYDRVLKHRKGQASWAFDKFIGQRNFSGRLVFPEHDKRMEPEVSTQKNSQGQWELGKSVKELSGGERSFSTLSMVLALSGASGSPFLAMDEFDVFMDETNRTVGLRMLVDVLRKKRDCQTIVISPLSIAEVSDGPDISKIKMKDRDGNQPTLAFE